MLIKILVHHFFAVKYKHMNAGLHFIFGANSPRFRHYISTRKFPPKHHFPNSLPKKGHSNKMRMNRGREKRGKYKRKEREKKKKKPRVEITNEHRQIRL